MKRTRRALSQHGGALRLGGDRAAAEALGAAFVRAAEEPADRFTHAFHGYPARMHPGLAAEVIARFADEGDLVVDPFAGSGTVPIEAMVAGLRSVGVDRSPLAVRLARVKAKRRRPDERARLEAAAAAIAERSEARVRARVPVRAPLSREEASHYAGHVLKELAGLREELLAETGPGDDREFLLMVFSSIVLKFSRQASETSGERSERRIRKGLVTEFFVRKANETLARSAALEAALADHAPAPRFVEASALSLGRALGEERADLVFTSPPYGGVYDYRDHHARRMPWLGIDPGALAREELGARRRHRGEGGSEGWESELAATLGVIARALSPGGRVVLMLGDALVGGALVPAERQVERLAGGAGLVPVAHASEARPSYGGQRREEHLIYLERD